MSFPKRNFKKNCKVLFFFSKPVDCPAGAGDFANVVVKGNTSLSAFELLAACQEIEQQMGRPPGHGYHEDRTIDIDILFYGDLSITSPRLTIPHPRMFSRDFVLIPLAEIAPDWSGSKPPN